MVFDKVIVKEEKFEDIGRFWEKLEGDEVRFLIFFQSKVGSMYEFRGECVSVCIREQNYQQMCIKGFGLFNYGSWLSVFCKVVILCLLMLEFVVYVVGSQEWKIGGKLQVGFYKYEREFIGQNEIRVGFCFFRFQWCGYFREIQDFC